MKLLALLAVLGCGYSAMALSTDYHEGRYIKNYFECPLKGCILECRMDNQEPLRIPDIRSITLTSYYKSASFYVLEMGIRDKRTVIIEGDTVMCQIIDHK